MFSNKASAPRGGIAKFRQTFGISLIGSGMAVLLNLPATGAQTKSFVVSWFTQATYSQDGDCPGGLNPEVDALTRQQLVSIGKTPAEIAAFMKDYASEPTTPALVDVLVNRGRIDGKPVNAYTYPESVADTHIHTVQGQYGYGFNLDGKGASSPNSFEDPQTHEKGINNQLFRAIGCFVSHRAAPPERSFYSAYPWSQKRPTTPAWVISITGEDLTKDGDVTVTVDRALQQALTDAAGNVQPDATFRQDPSPTTHNVFHGKLNHGVVAVSDGHFHMLADPALMPGYEIKQTHMRLNLRDDGNLDGLVGGYQPWLELYYYYSGLGYPAEYTFAVDIPGVYHALKRLADAYPDAKTGRNTHISTAYRIEAVPAFVVPAANSANDKQAFVSPAGEARKQ